MFDFKKLMLFSIQVEVRVELGKTPKTRRTKINVEYRRFPSAIYKGNFLLQQFEYCISIKQVLGLQSQTTLTFKFGLKQCKL